MSSTKKNKHTNQTTRKRTQTDLLSRELATTPTKRNETHTETETMVQQPISLHPSQHINTSCTRQDRQCDVGSEGALNRQQPGWMHYVRPVVLIHSTTSQQQSYQMPTAGSGTFPTNQQDKNYYHSFREWDLDFNKLKN